MKALFFLLFFQFITCLAFCQIDAGSIKILETILRREYPTGTLYYTDKLDSSIVLWIKENLQKRNLVGITRKKIDERIKLTKKEKRYLDSNINTLFSFCWKDSLFENSKRMPNDSMWAHIRRRNREATNLAKEAEAAGRKPIYDRVMSSSTFQFSFPVYFRDRSVFLLYFIRMCGSECGHNELAFYRLINGNYERWLLVNGGEF
jgi:hypothetical protein